VSVFVTTSWDDGHVLDHQLARLLDMYDLPGTFYVAPRNVELRPRERLDARGLRLLAERFEIGGHTLNHLRLTTLADPAAHAEIRDGKNALEDVIGKPLHSFCYPGGCYEPRHVPMVDGAGFRVGRTVERLVSDPSPALEMGSTMHAYRHLVDAPVSLRMTSFKPNEARRLYWNWDEMAIRLFEDVLASGGVYHLWGHSWEVAANNDWNRLERVFAHISRRTGVQYVDNGDLPLVGAAA
jgi:peptidoglycan/xylan/chitin deacetylase (PgdA/CDA1 family)